MQNKLFLGFILSLFLSINLFSQTALKEIENSAKDPFKLMQVDKGLTYKELTERHFLLVEKLKREKTTLEINDSELIERYDNAIKIINVTTFLLLKELDKPFLIRLYNNIFHDGKYNTDVTLEQRGCMINFYFRDDTATYTVEFDTNILAIVGRATTHQAIKDKIKTAPLREKIRLQSEIQTKVLDKMNELTSEMIGRIEELNDFLKNAENMG